jgi:hypothetical protein
MASLVIERLKQPIPRTIYALSTDPFLLGRHYQAIFTTRSVSRKHAQIVRTEDEYLIEDLNSRNGTWVNGNRISCRTQLRNRDRIRIGDYILLFKNRDKPKNPADPTLIALLQTYYQDGDEVVRCALIDWLEEHGDRRADLIRNGYGGDGLAEEELIPFPQTDRAHRDWMHWLFPELEWPPQLPEIIG